MFSRNRQPEKAATAAADMATEYFHDGTEAIARSKDELMKEFENLVGAGEALLKSTSGLSVDARDAFSTRLADAQSRYHELTRAARVKSRKAATATDEYVHANPWPAIGIAAGIAFVVGAITMRR